MPNSHRAQRPFDRLAAQARGFLPQAAIAPLKLAGIFALAVLLASVAIALTRHEGRIAAIWPINAVIFVILLQHRRAEWGPLVAAFCAGLFTANLLALDGIARASLFTFANAVEVMLVGALFTAGRRPKLISSTGVYRLFGAAAAGCAVSTLIATCGLAALGSGFLPPQGMALWFAADSLGYVLAAPVMWSLIDRSRRNEGKADWREAALQFAVLAAATVLVFAQTLFPLLFIIAPVLVWMAFSGGARRAALGMLLVTAISLPMTLQGSGPISLVDAGLATHIIVLQLFLATNSMLCLATGAEMSERRRLLGQLDRSRARLQATLQYQQDMLGKAQLAEQMAGVGHWTLEVETSNIYWSPEVYAIHGVTPDIFDPKFDDAVAFYVEEDRERIKSLIAQGLETGEGWEFEAVLRRADGELRHVQALAQCVPDSAGVTRRVFGVFKDITEDRKLFDDLSEREEQYRILADHSTDIIVQFGPDGKITYASPSCWILGVQPAEAIGKTPVDFVIDEDKALAAEAIRLNFSPDQGGTPVRRQFRVRNFFGETIWLEGSPQVMLGDDGEPASVVSTFRDVTDRVEREQALAEARREAETAAKAKAEFLANMSHEIRTPLNGMLGFTQLISQTDLSQEQQHFVERIAGAGRMLRALVDDILDFSKIESGKMEIESVSFDLAQVVTEVVELVDAGRTHNTVPIRQAIDLGDAGSVSGDEVKVRQILTNVLANACKFTSEGSIDVSVKREGGKVILSVRDTGEGIAADKLETIFEGFRQADSTVTRRHGGTGLGLSISRSLARMMGGDITVESSLGEGTRVSIALPLATMQTPALSAADAAPLPAPRSVRVMAVDDVPVNLELVRIGLSAAGHEVTTFTSAQAAIDALAGGAGCDVVLMDIQMPEMDGLTATRKIRSLPGKPAGLPIVAMTAHAQASEIESFLDAGMDTHFSKPIDLDKLDTLVRRLAENANVPASAASRPSADPLDKLRQDYRRYLATVSDEVETILALTGDEKVLEGILSLAHAIAGAAGGLGFADVSKEAFELEALVRQFRASKLSPEALQPKVDAFLSVIDKACA